MLKREEMEMARQEVGQGSRREGEEGADRGEKEGEGEGGVRRGGG